MEYSNAPLWATGNNSSRNWFNDVNTSSASDNFVEICDVIKRNFLTSNHNLSLKRFPV